MTRGEREMGHAVRCWAAAFLFGALAWVALGSLAWWALGCATGHVRPDGEMVCVAIGEDARVFYSSPQGEPGIIVSAPVKQIECAGGAIIPSVLDGIGTVVKALFSWIVL